jgi:nucleotide-binding universal stress UspA family protein
MKKILFPTDFSEVANNAFMHALELAHLVKAEIVLLHTFELPIVDNQYFPLNYSVLYESIELANFEMFKGEIPKLRAVAEERNRQHIKLSHRLMDGDLLFNLKKSIKEESIDFVVMGTSGATGWEFFFIGSNTGSVLAGVDVPVLCVPFEAKYTKIKTIGFTTRYREKDKKALLEVIKLAKKMKAEVRCLYVKTSHSDVKLETIKQWETEFKTQPVHFMITQSDDVQGTILDFISRKEIDMLAMLTYKRNFFYELFNPSLTKKVSNHSNIPVLALHE